MRCSLWHSLQGCAERSQESPACPMVLLRAAEGHLLFAGKSLDVAEMLLLLLPSSATGTIPTELVGLPAIHGATLLRHSHSWDVALPLSIGMAPGCDTAKGDFPSSILSWRGRYSVGALQKSEHLGKLPQNRAELLKKKNHLGNSLEHHEVQRKKSCKAQRKFLEITRKIPRIPHVTNF